MPPPSVSVEAMAGAVEALYGRESDSPVVVERRQAVLDEQDFQINTHYPPMTPSDNMETGNEYLTKRMREGATIQDRDGRSGV